MPPAVVVIDRSRHQDSPGPMGKSAWDLAAVISSVKEPRGNQDYMKAVESGYKTPIDEFDIGIVRYAHPCTKDIDPNDSVLIAECTALYDKVIAMMQPKVDPVECPAVDELAKEHDVVGFDADGKWAGIPDYLVTFGAFAESVNKYLAGLDETQIKTFDDIIQWNDHHPASLNPITEHARRRHANQQELAFHSDAFEREDRQAYLEVASTLFHEREKYSPAIRKAEDLILAWKKEMLDYMTEKKLDLLVVTAGILGMSGPAIGAATCLPVVRFAGRRSVWPGNADVRAQSPWDS